MSIRNIILLFPIVIIALIASFYIFLLAMSYYPYKINAQNPCSNSGVKTADQCPNGGDIFVNAGEVNVDSTEEVYNSDGYFVYSRGGWGAGSQSIIGYYRKLFPPKSYCSNDQIVRKCGKLDWSK